MKGSHSVSVQCRVCLCCFSVGLALHLRQVYAAFVSGLLCESIGTVSIGIGCQLLLCVHQLLLSAKSLVKMRKAHSDIYVYSLADMTVMVSNPASSHGSCHGKIHGSR